MSIILKANKVNLFVSSVLFFLVPVTDLSRHTTYSSVKSLQIRVHQTQERPARSVLHQPNNDDTKGGSWVLKEIVSKILCAVCPTSIEMAVVGVCGGWGGWVGTKMERSLENFVKQGACAIAAAHVGTHVNWVPVDHAPWLGSCYENNVPAVM
jgi:hypothetical protein